jgi:hypothetical protein
VDARDRLLAVPGAWRIFTEKVDGGYVARWAVRALEMEIDSPHLRQLASFGDSASWFEVEPILKRAMTELEIEPIGEEAARRHHLTEMLSALVVGAVTVDEALEEIHTTVVSPLKHPKDLQIWCDLHDGLVRDPTDHVVKVLTKDARDARVREEAARCVGSGRPI